MANYEAIMRHYPEVREFVRNRRWVHRGDVLFYGADTKGEHFSTDSAGFRHSAQTAVRPRGPRTEAWRGGRRDP
jgi:hypothetical protein